MNKYLHFNIYDYISEINDINLEKLEKRLMTMYKSWYLVKSMLKKYSNEPESIRTEKVKRKLGKKGKNNALIALGAWLSFTDLTDIISRLNLSATFKDQLGTFHSLDIADIKFPHRFNVLFCKFFRKRIKVFANDVLVDGVSVIDEFTFEYKEPKYISRVEKFINEFKNIEGTHEYN